MKIIYIHFIINLECDCFLIFLFLFKCGNYNILPSWFPALLLHCSADQICKLDVEDTQVSARLAVQLIQVQGRIQEGGGGRSSAPPGRSALKYTCIQITGVYSKVQGGGGT